MHATRRQWLKRTTLSGLALAALPPAAWARGARRSFHVCLSPTVVASDPELLETVRAAGVNAVWIAGYFYGHWTFSPEQIRRARALVRRAGMEACLVNVPLGHPGDSLGSSDGSFPLTPSGQWKVARRPDGKAYVGTSLHQPATAENVGALRELRKLGLRRCFLDDDFRLARSPGEIGGCFCEDHRREFLRQAGLPENRWPELLDDVKIRRLTPLLRAWVNFQCDALTESFRAQARAFDGELGNMIMYLGAEKAGIRLKDYRHAPFRVGELMFGDSSFAPVKGKTDELFSVLFHRRYAQPERAFSETTAYPADALSASNMAAKLVISTVADVRHTMFMSGLTPFPRAHWSVLAPAMKTQARLHEELAGQRPRGPLKHYWGEAQRWVGNDQPFSLWLALGVPFEVVDDLPQDGCLFLSDFDAQAQAKLEPRKGVRVVCRSSAHARPAESEAMEETLPALFDFKRSLGPLLKAVPHVLEDAPAVCAWYPGVRRVLVWNLSTQAKALTIALGEQRYPVPLDSLEATTVRLDTAASPRVKRM